MRASGVAGINQIGSASGRVSASGSGSGSVSASTDTKLASDDLGDISGVSIWLNNLIAENT